jgi:hypothetical protein
MVKSEIQWIVDAYYMLKKKVSVLLFAVRCPRVINIKTTWFFAAAALRRSAVKHLKRLPSGNLT